jgi:hypothetical protein
VSKRIAVRGSKQATSAFNSSIFLVPSYYNAHCKKKYSKLQQDDKKNVEKHKPSKNRGKPTRDRKRSGS